MHSHSHNNFSIDKWTYHSGIRDWNTEYKLLFSFAAIIIVIASDSIIAALFTFIFMSVLNLSVAKLTIYDYLKVMSIPAAFILLGSIAIGICFSNKVHGGYCIDIGFIYLYVTKESLTDMFNVMIKAFSSISSMYLFTLSTPVGEFVSTLKKFHLPDIFVELMHLIYRYIFILLDAQQRMRNAGESRLGYIDFRTSCRSFSKMLGNLLIVSMKNSRTCFDAMESRCYDGSCEFYFIKRRCTKVQSVVMILYFIVVLAILVVQKIVF